MGKEQIQTTLEASGLDWSSIDPSILGTLFERGLDPDKRSQLGAHYTDRDKIMRIIDPVIVRPLLAEWETVKNRIADSLKRAGKAKSQGAATRQRRRAENTLGAFLERLRAFTVLDPACGSATSSTLRSTPSMTWSTKSNWRPRRWVSSGASRRRPANVKGIELNAYAT